MKDALDLMLKMACVGIMAIIGVLGFGIYKLVMWLI